MVFAKGGAFNTSGVKFFANGGVVNRPTAFGMSGGLGVAGEAGPEAILPLSRGPGGNLGVEAASPVVNVIDQRSGGGDVQVMQNGGEVDIMIADSFRRQLSQGSFDSEFQNQFGQTRVPSI